VSDQLDTRDTLPPGKENPWYPLN